MTVNDNDNDNGWGFYVEIDRPNTCNHKYQPLEHYNNCKNKKYPKIIGLPTIQEDSIDLELGECDENENKNENKNNNNFVHSFCIILLFMTVHLLIS